MQKENVNWQNLFKQAVDHRNNHDCSAYPYENGDRLLQIIEQYKSKKILEIGTGIGYTAAIMALASPEAQIESLEKDAEHVALAEQFLQQNSVADRVKVINETAEELMGTLPAQSYDLIFFDGFQIHYEFLPHYIRLLKPGGILFLANNHLQSKTSAQFFVELKTSKTWKILDQFADTIITQKLNS